MRNGYYVNDCRVDWNCLIFDENNEYIDYSENISSVYFFRNGYSV